METSTTRPAGPSDAAVTAARATVDRILEIEQGEGGQWLLSLIEQRRDAFASQVLNNDELSDNDRALKRAAYRAVKELRNTVTTRFNDALNTLHLAGAVPSELVDRLPHPEPQPPAVPSIEAANPFDLRFAKPEEPPAPA